VIRGVGEECFGAGGVVADIVRHPTEDLFR